MRRGLQITKVAVSAVPLLYRQDPHKAAAMIAEGARTFAEEIKQ